MKKSLPITLGGTLSVFLVAFFELSVIAPDFGCACIGEKEELLLHLEELKDVLESHKESHKTYPNLEELEVLIRGSYLEDSIAPYSEGTILQEGVYYGILEEGESYILEGYLEGEKEVTFFGLKVFEEFILVNVNESTPN